MGWGECTSSPTTREGKFREAGPPQGDAQQVGGFDLQTRPPSPCHVTTLLDTPISPVLGQRSYIPGPWQHPHCHPHCLGGGRTEDLTPWQLPHRSRPEREDRDAGLHLDPELRAWTPQQELHRLCCSPDNRGQETPANPVAPSGPSPPRRRASGSQRRPGSLTPAPPSAQRSEPLGPHRKSDDGSGA